MSAIAFINASVVQGSGIGPSSYIVVASDLKPINRETKIAKYTDDSYLLIGSITTWALQNQNSSIFSRGRQEITYALTPSRPRN